MSWTEERVEILTKLWTEGLSASQIARELGGVTRNAVIGKVHRLGLSGRAKPTKSSVPRTRKPKTTNQPSRNPTPKYSTVGATALKNELEVEVDAIAEPQVAEIHELVIPVEERKNILQLTESTCKWPIGDPGDDDFHFCGRNADNSSPYCEHHSKIAYQTLNDRRRDKKVAG